MQPHLSPAGRVFVWQNQANFGPVGFPRPGRGPTLPNEPKFVSAGNCLFPLNQRLPATRSLPDRFAEPTQFRPFPHSPLGGSSFWRNKPNSSPFHPPAPRTPYYQTNRDYLLDKVSGMRHTTGRG